MPWYVTNLIWPHIKIVYVHIFCMFFSSHTPLCVMRKHYNISNREIQWDKSLLCGLLALKKKKCLLWFYTHQVLCFDRYDECVC
jgi:hypothetical protein